MQAHYEEGVLAELRSGDRLVDDATLEGMASCLHEKTGSLSVHDLAKAAGATIVETDELPNKVLGTLFESAILVRPQRVRAIVLLAILHELAHFLLEGRYVTHADVWTLTLALATPRELAAKGFHMSCPDDCDLIPQWALDERQRYLAIAIAAAS